MYEEPVELDAHHPVEPSLPRKRNIRGAVLGGGVGLLGGLVVSQLSDIPDVLPACGVGLGLGVPLGALVARLTGRSRS